MPQLMPYHLEKGPTIRLLEQHLNGSAEEMRTTLGSLRASVGTPDWILTGLPTLWEDPRFAHSPLGSGPAVQQNLVEKWLGFEDVDGKFEPGTGATTGYWVAYRGDVNEIVRQTLQWAFEQSFGLEPGEEADGREDPWPIEIFWKCPTPWFEGWVVTRPVDDERSAERGGRLWRRVFDHTPHRHEHRGLVTVIFMTPSHSGANVAESPVAQSPTTFPPGVTHAIPSWQDDYEVLGQPHPDPVGFPDRPRVPAGERRFSSWIVTHEDHHTAGEIDVTTNTAVAADFADWGVPQVSIYEGIGPIVVVSPSVAAGGVPEDGEV